MSDNGLTDEKRVSEEMSKRTTILTMVGVAVIMLVIGVALGSVAFPMLKTETTTQESNVTATQTLVSIVEHTLTQTQHDIIPCTSDYPNGTAPPEVPVLFAGQNSTLTMCVRFYYYNSSNSETFNTTSLLDVRGTHGVEIPPYPFNLNITINAYPSQLTLGGSSNLNEGEIVLYVINTGDTSNGSYTLNLSALLYPSLENCAGFTSLIVTSPNPDYASFGGCLVLADRGVLNPYGFVGGALTAKVIAMSNSTE